MINGISKSTNVNLLHYEMEESVQGGQLKTWILHLTWKSPKITFKQLKMLKLK